jgi:hypothetical protein
MAGLPLVEMQVEEVNQARQVSHAVEFDAWNFEVQSLHRKHRNLNAVNRIGAQLDQAFVQGDILGPQVGQDLEDVGLDDGKDSVPVHVSSRGERRLSELITSNTPTSGDSKREAKK